MVPGVSRFQGTCTVAVREYYQEDGAWMLGMKRFSLTPEQFSTLCSNQQVPKLAAAVACLRSACTAHMAHLADAELPSGLIGVPAFGECCVAAYFLFSSIGMRWTRFLFLNMVIVSDGTPGIGCH